MRKFISLAVVTILLVVTSALGAPVRSGPQVGDKVPGPFRPLHVNGPDAGKRVCLYCKYGSKPVAMIFAREITPALATLFSKIDAISSSADAEPGCFAVFLGDVEKWTAPLQQTAGRCALKKLVLTVHGPSAPASYEIANDAAVTVILYREHTVKANHSFRSGELDDKAAAAILADFAKMLQEK